MKIKHISFDVWNTLITANPEYARARTEYFAQKFMLDVNYVKQVYTDTKRYIDSAAETHGVGYTTNACMRLFLVNLDIGWNERQAKLLNVDEYVDALNQLFMDFPPFVEEELINEIKRLKFARYGLSIGSNSNFISGDVMSIFLHTKFGSVFSFEIYSDRICYAKPNTIFFNRIFTNTHMDVRYKAEIVHIGDSQVCDVQGAIDYGFCAALITSPSNLVERLKDYEY